MSKPILRKIYSSLVHPYLIYGVEVWGHSRCSKLSKLLNIQNKCLKIISDHSCPNIMTFDTITKFFSLNKLYQVLFLNRLPTYKNSILINQVTHSHLTRFSHSDRSLCPHSHLAIRQFSFMYKSIKFWNEIPLDIRKSSSYLLFKQKLRSFLCI